MVSAIYDIDVSERITCHAPGSLELPRTASLFAPLRQETSPAVELLDAVIAFIGDKDVANEINGDAAWKEKGTVKTSIAPPFQQRGAVGFELLDPRIAGVGDVDVALFVRGNAPWHIELAHLGPTPGKAKLAPGLHRSAFGVELLDAVVAAIRNVHLPLRTTRQSSGIVKLSLLTTRFTTP